MTKRGFLAVGLMAVMAGTAAGQQGPGRGMGMMGGMMPNVEELSTKLDLNAEQKAKLSTLVAGFQAETKEPREVMQANMQMVREGTVTMESVREENQAAMGKIRANLEKLNKDIRSMLTPEQQKTFDEYLEAQRERMRQMRGNRPPPSR